MATPKDAPYKQRQKRPLYATLWHGTARSRAHPDRAYVRDQGGTIWRKENHDARFGRVGFGKGKR